MTSKRELTEEAQQDSIDFEALYGSGNCSCFMNAPCSSCLHPGNPRNQEDDETCWKEVPSE